MKILHSAGEMVKTSMPIVYLLELNDSSPSSKALLICTVNCVSRKNFKVKGRAA